MCDFEFSAQKRYHWCSLYIEIAARGTQSRIIKLCVSCVDLEKAFYKVSYKVTK